jgi:hypothetical protein
MASSFFNDFSKRKRVFLSFGSIRVYAPVEATTIAAATASQMGFARRSTSRFDGTPPAELET